MMGMMNQKPEQIIHLHRTQIQDILAIYHAIDIEFSEWARGLKCLVLTKKDVLGVFASFWPGNKDKFKFPDYSEVTVKQIAYEVVCRYYGEVK
jgi:hypothetical protein